MNRSEDLFGPSETLRGGISAMASKEMGTDQMFVFPTAEIAILGAPPAVDILYRKKSNRRTTRKPFGRVK